MSLAKLGNYLGTCRLRFTAVLKPAVSHGASNRRHTTKNGPLCQTSNGASMPTKECSKFVQRIYLMQSGFELLIGRDPPDMTISFSKGVLIELPKSKASGYR